MIYFRHWYYKGYLLKGISMRKMSGAMVAVSQNRKSGVFNPKTFSGVRGNSFLKYVVTMLGSGLLLCVIFSNTVNGNFPTMNIYTTCINKNPFLFIWPFISLLFFLVDHAWDQVQNVQDEIRNLSTNLKNVTEGSQPQTESKNVGKMWQDI